LERLSGGRYPAARHGLRSTVERMQLSLVFSFDPGEAHVPARLTRSFPVESMPVALAEEEDEALELLMPERLTALKSGVRSGPV
jgi:hypothetical protein